MSNKHNHRRKNRTPKCFYRGENEGKVLDLHINETDTVLLILRHLRPALDWQLTSQTFSEIVFEASWDNPIIGLRTDRDEHIHAGQVATREVQKQHPRRDVSEALRQKTTIEVIMHKNEMRFITVYVSLWMHVVVKFGKKSTSERVLLAAFSITTASRTKENDWPVTFELYVKRLLERLSDQLTGRIDMRPVITKPRKLEPTPPPDVLADPR